MKTTNNKKPAIPQTDFPQQLIHEFQQSISVPLHHPAFLKEFAQFDSSFPERILLMTEKEQLHQHQKENREIRISEKNIEMEERKLFHAIFETYAGMIIAAIIALAFCYGGIHVILEGYPIAGLSILAGVISVLVLTFIQGRKK